MTIQEIKSKGDWKLYNFKNEGIQVFSATEKGSRMNYKYLCNIYKKGKSFFVKGYKPTGKYEVLKQQVEEYVKSLPYNSEYYYPDYRAGLFEELIIGDYLTSLGFVSEKGHYKSIYYILKQKTIYNSSGNKLALCISGLEPPLNDEKLSETISIKLYLGDYSWVAATVKRNIDEIKKGIDNILKPYFVHSSVRDFQLTEKLENTDNIDILLHAIGTKNKTLGITSIEYKQKLKESLLELADKIII